MEGKKTIYHVWGLKSKFGDLVGENPYRAVPALFPTKKMASIEGRKLKPKAKPIHVVVVFMDK